MHRPMPDIYDGELITHHRRDLRPAAGAGPHQRAVASSPISNGHGAWAMALSNTLSAAISCSCSSAGGSARCGPRWPVRRPADRDDGGRRRASPIDPQSVEARLRADIGAGDQGGADGAHRHRLVGPQRRCRDPAALDAADHPALLMVDCIASMGCEQFEMDAWGVDVTVVGIAEGADDAARSGVRVGRPPGDWRPTPTPTCGRGTGTGRSAPRTARYYLRFCGTPPVTHLFGLREALTMIDEEGLEHDGSATACSPTRSAPRSTPGRRQGHRVPRPAPRPSGRLGDHHRDRLARLAALTTICRDELGVTLGVGLGPLEGRGFRIAHMGHVSPSMVLGVLGVVETALHRLHADPPRSGVAAAAAALAHT